MAQWVNHLQNNTFVNPPPLLCEISEALHLAQLGLIWLAGWQTKYTSILKFLKKLAVGRNIRLVTLFNQGTALLQSYQCIPASFFG